MLYIHQQTDKKCIENSCLFGRQREASDKDWDGGIIVTAVEQYDIMNQNIHDV